MPPDSTNCEYSEAVLCELCNRNQILKVRQLADFIPENEAAYDQEVERYEMYLENIYGLCRRCEQAVKEVVGKQDTILHKKLARYHRNAVQQADVSTSDSICSVSLIL